MAATIALELITPTRLAAEVAVTEVTLPGALGEFTVLPDHAPYVAQLKPGILRYTAGGEQSAFVIGSGFAEVLNNKLLVLTRSVEPRASLDKAALSARLGETVRRFDAMDPADAAYGATGEEIQRLRAGLDLVAS